jgi:hypothetical protein
LVRAGSSVGVVIVKKPGPGGIRQKNLQKKDSIERVERAGTFYILVPSVVNGKKLFKSHPVHFFYSG